MATYEQACQCAAKKKPTSEGAGESEENTEKTREFVAQKSRVAGQAGSKGGYGRSGKPGENAKPNRGLTKKTRACICGDYGQRGNRGQHGR